MTEGRYGSVFLKTFIGSTKGIFIFASMTTQEKVALKEIIEKKIVSIDDQIEDLKELTKPIAPDCAIGRVSRMDAINNKAINDNALSKKRQQLQGLQDALENIDMPDFGKCISCGAPIPIGRILLVPESRICVKCAGRR